MLFSIFGVWISSQDSEVHVTKRREKIISTRGGEKECFLSDENMKERLARSEWPARRSEAVLWRHCINLCEDQASGLQMADWMMGTVRSACG